jgi:transcriptional regulator with XRE-family HTH domain
MPIGDQLKRLRKAAGISQQTLATRAGLSMSAVIHIEAGRIPDPRGSTLKALARALGATVDELLAEDEETPAPEASQEQPPERPARPKRPRRKGGDE